MGFFQYKIAWHPIYPAGWKSKRPGAIILTALNTGTRNGEILSLNRGNVDSRNGCIAVERTKNAEIRKIPMNEPLTIALKNVKSSLPSHEYLSSSDGKQP
jgi:integrase